MRSKNKGRLILLEIVLAALVMIVLGVGLCSAYRYFFRAAYPVRYDEMVEQFSEEYGLPPSLVYAVIRTESSFRPEAQSSIPARGLMQITQETFEWAQYRIDEDAELHYDDLFDPELNIRYGTAILRLHLNEFGTVENALCAYHAGYGSVQQWLADPSISPDGRNILKIPYNDTKRYVSKVLETQRLYNTLYDIP